MERKSSLRLPDRRVTKLFRIAVALSLILVWSMPAVVLAAGGAKATKIYNVADTRELDSGVSKWIADIYNGNLWLFGAVVVITMAGMGLILGLGMDRLLQLLGINLGKLQHHE